MVAKPPRHGQNVEWWCDKCNKPACVREINRYYCAEHWQETPYAQELTMARINRMNEDE